MDQHLGPNALEDEPHHQSFCASVQELAASDQKSLNG
jgi:hypothetical protein